MSSLTTEKRFSADLRFAFVALAVLLRAFAASARFAAFVAFARGVSFARTVSFEGGAAFVRFALLALLASLASLTLVACGRREKEEPQGSAPATRVEQPAGSESSAPTAEANGAALEPQASAADPETSAAASASLEIVTADDLKRKVRASGRKGTLVNAWASFCGPCKREVPMLAGIAQNLRPRGLDVVLVSLDEPSDREKAVAFLRERKIGLESYVAERPLGPFKMGMNPRWRGMLPASFLFDADGTLRYFWGGEAFESEVVPVLEAFLAGRPLEGEANFPVAPESPSPN